MCNLLILVRFGQLIKNTTRNEYYEKLSYHMPDLIQFFWNCRQNVNLIVVYHLYFKCYDLSLIMIEEVAIVAIFGSCGFLTWIAMKKHNSKIERRLDEIDAHSTRLEVTERKFKK